jgi:5-methyltetrahydropteroyltriglutamate--homocysteine methyltransferase
MTIASNLGFPRIGRRRELKTALEAFWAGRSSEAELLASAAALRATHWDLQQGLGIGHLPSNDAPLYDHVLDTALMLGVIPPGYGWSEGPVSLATTFALARGTSGTAAERAAALAPGLPALEMTKLFDTNYHYLVPRLATGQSFSLTENRPLAAFREAALRNQRTRPVLLGPVSFLRLAKTEDGSDPLRHLDALLPLYGEVLRELALAGAAWVQMDEPVLALDLPPAAVAAISRAYRALAVPDAPHILLASYFGAPGDALPTLLDLPVAGLHLDLVRGPEALAPVLDSARPDLWLSLGVVDGRNVWRTDLRSALATLRQAAERRGTARLMVAPSCSLVHVPVDLRQEASLPKPLQSWLSFATQKLQEVTLLARALDEGDTAIADALKQCDAALADRRASTSVHDPDVAARLGSVTAQMENRQSPFPDRREKQRARHALPAFPTTTIGSLPQTAEVRAARAGLARGTLDQAGYDAAIAGWIDDALQRQEEIGLDVLVHGEFERNDMVKYFGERLAGFAFTAHGWVQSYGSRCVAPPIIWGDVSRPEPISLRWTSYAQSRTSRPVKGMLTGPVTMLQWSFVRDDIPRETVCRQIALALRDEVADLERAGIGFIQIDEPALREGLPLRHAAWETYLRWAIASFRLAASGVADETQLHTHMCYADFNDIIDAIAAMDADVISIEATRSRMELLEAFRRHRYPNEIGPGIWDIHSPRVPDVKEMAELLLAARSRLEDWQIWVNPDCGLKTRKWEEVLPALQNMVQAAQSLRAGG